MKLLIVRFSSIGDIVLTTPIVRCIKQQIPSAAVHYLTKAKFLSVIEHNPYVDKFYTITDSVFEITKELKKENYDYVIDLHHNIRTLKLKLTLGKKAFSFNKLNWGKFLMVNFKINKLPNTHIVDRYFETLKTLGITNDNKGLDYFIPTKDEVDVNTYLPQSFKNGYNVLVVGGSYYTKQIPLNKLLEIVEKSTLPLVLLGGKENKAIADNIIKVYPNKTVNGCGTLNLNQSASLIQQSQKVITSDTGLMHIAAAFKKEIISLWGNTIPEFGMGPYLADPKSKILEVKNLSCRPCSKLGYHSCPKKHFRCMNNIVLGDL
jgi:ADP-heptose:LPS heptosyltransferase